MNKCSNKTQETGSEKIASRNLGRRTYELKDHLGNVRVTLSDALAYNANTSTMDARVMNYTNYYPFGMMQYSNSSMANNNYRFGFNGKEMDNEVSGTGNQYDYGFRIYNPRIAKFLSVDPLTKSYPMLTPYQYASNRPIDGIDLDGLEHVTYQAMFFDDDGAYVDVTSLNHFDISNYNDRQTLTQIMGIDVSQFDNPNSSYNYIDYKPINLKDKGYSVMNEVSAVTCNGKINKIRSLYDFGIYLDNIIPQGDAYGEWEGHNGPFEEGGAYGYAQIQSKTFVERVETKGSETVGGTEKIETVRQTKVVASNKNGETKAGVGIYMKFNGANNKLNSDFIFEYNGGIFNINYKALDRKLRLEITTPSSPGFKMKAEHVLEKEVLHSKQINWNE